MSTQTIIVYRSPLEEAFWGVLMSGALTPLLVSFLIAVGVAAFVQHIFKGKRVFGNDLSVQSFFAAFFISICVLYFL